MLRCDRCGSLLTILRIHKKRVFCDNCKAWIGWAVHADPDCIECAIEHAKHSKQ